RKAKQTTKSAKATFIYKRKNKGDDENVNVKAVVAVLILGMFVSILNQTIINVALPPLMNEFNVSTSTAQWLITGFM
ncbi:drug resistance transporter, EmrB/QacA subfamily, partial [Bacillus cereus G9241]